METKNQIIEVNGKSPTLPFDKLEVGDILVAKYTASDWANIIPWEGWHHAGLISEINGEEVKIIEAPGGNKESEEKVGPIERNIVKSLFNLDKDSLIELVILKPKFPNPIREKGKWFVPRIFHKKITELEARERAIAYAREQIKQNEPYNEFSSKWNENEWYCSKLVYKAYSMSVYDMYLESYLAKTQPTKGISSGPFVTPEDLVDSNRSEIYYHFKKEDDEK